MVGYVKDPPPYFEGIPWLTDMAEFVNAHTLHRARMHGSVLVLDPELTPVHHADLIESIRNLCPFDLKQVEDIRLEEPPVEPEPAT